MSQPKPPRYRIPGLGLLRAILSVGLLAAAGVQAAELSFGKPGSPPHTFALEKLQGRLPSHRIEYFDPHYGKEKRFLGFALADLLDLGFGADWRGQDDAELIFEALDGYRSIGARTQLTEPGGYVVFRDIDRDGWEPIGERHVDPAPFYLVWTQPGQTTAAGYPWPWQLSKIELVSYCARFPNVCPEEVHGPESPVRRGFDLFKALCVSCHAISGQGGQVGPDLNAPMNITEYRSEYMLKAFIRQPSRFRYTHMPDHTELSDGDLDDILSYLRDAKARGVSYARP